MRRSAAPSAVSLSKRPRFVTPFKATPGEPENCLGKAEKPIHTAKTSQPVRQTTRENPEKENTNMKGRRKYYSVMWCKLSKKKHKKWEGDAVLSTEGRTALLKDMEAKDIAKSTGYKTSDLDELAEGSTLVIGGKEIEVMGVISECDWQSGSCFTGGDVRAEVATPPRGLPQPSKRNSNPFVRKLASGRSEASFASASPLFDVKTLANALVMPRPSQAHQWERNKNGLPVVDVVVDPHVANRLRPHQRDGVVFLYECVMGMRSFSGTGAILADEMGLGKTIQCIALLWTMLKQGMYGGKPAAKRILIITPSSLVKNWEKEIRKWLGPERLKPYAVGGDQKAKDFEHASLYPVMIISYEMYLRCHQQIRSVRFDLVICDEGHRLKNTSIKTASAIMDIPTRRRILLTGTPVQNDLQEFFAIVEFCNPGVLGSSSSFHRLYEEPILRSRQKDCSPDDKELGDARAAELLRLTSLFCLRRTQEVNEKYLPPKVENVVFCKPSSLQLILYKKFLESRAVRSCFESGGAAPHLLCIDALKKLCNSPSLVYKAARERQASDEDEESLYCNLEATFPATYISDDDDSIPLHVDDCGKMRALVRMLEYLYGLEVREKVVVVSNYTKTLDLLQTLCQRHDYEYLRLDGSTPSEKRMSTVEKFNRLDDSHFVFLLSSKAGGVGLNLTGASRLILYDVDWNPANDMQAMARVWRDGQRKTVRIYRLLTTGTIEEKMYQRQIMKQGLSGAVVNAGRSGKSHFTREELKDLFTLREATCCDTHDLLFKSTEQRVEPLGAADREPSRSCQLAVALNPSRSRAQAVCELTSWRRYAEPISQSTIEDEAILSAESVVSFVFQTERNASRL